MFNLSFILIESIVEKSKQNHIIKSSKSKLMTSASGINKSTESTSKNNDWLLCAKWLSDCKCLPYPVQQRLLSNELTLGEFANVLRDGEILCNLANYLIPGSIDVTQINKRAHMSQMLCLKNIRLFLNACNSPAYFNLDESDLFDEHMLYEFDLARVIQALSILSKTKASTDKGCRGFSLMGSSKNNMSSSTSHNGLSDNSRPSSTSLLNTSQNLNDDIYYNILPAEIEGPESYYTDESFLFGSQMNDSNDQSDNGVYQIIVQQQPSHQPLKRDFVIREILNTEENFVNGLDTLWDDFLQPLSKILNDDDRKCICINIENLIKLHKQTLYADLFQACKGGVGRTQRICYVFENVKLEIMKEYAEYFSCIDRSLAKCDSLTNSHSNQSSLYGNAKPGNYASEFRSKLEECRKTSKRGNFKLTDLLRLPYQRVLKYHLLFNELLKQTDIEHSAKELIKITRDSMCEVGNFLNECQRDKENITQIEKIMAHLTIDSKGSSNSSLKDYGHYIKDDKFRIRSIDSGERIPRTRTMFLFEKALIVCKSKSDLYNYKEALLIDEYTIEDPSVTNNSNSNTSSLDLSNGAVNLSLIGGSGANAHSLAVYNSNRTKVYAFYFKNQEQKRIWKQCLFQAKDKIQPKGQRQNKHMFLFTNFKHDMVICAVCKKYLLGIFYQGYKCELCSQVVHKDCLTKTSLCTVDTISPSLQHTPMPFKNGNKNARINSMSSLHSHMQSSPVITLERSMSTCSASSSKQFCVRAIYRYDGRPDPPELPVLLFNEGDLIQVTDDDDDYWWKGYLIKYKKSGSQNPTKEEGHFPSSYVRVFSNDTKKNSISSMNSMKNNLDEYPWFAPVDRNTADLILNRIQNFPAQTLFMVRCRQEGGYAISIKCNGLVDHIKINVTYLDSLGNNHTVNNLSSTLQQSLSLNSNGSIETTTSAFYSIDQRNFSSVVGLVKFYCQNTLKENFPQLETTLGMPYREALPIPISIAIAMHDYDPLTNPNNTGEQIDLRTLGKYYILNKEPNGWWRVYNSDGLIGYAPGGYLQETRVQ